MGEVARRANSAGRPLSGIGHWTSLPSTTEVTEAEGDERGGRERLRISGYKWQAGPLKLFQEQPPYTHVHSIYAHTITHSSRKEIT